MKFAKYIVVLFLLNMPVSCMEKISVNDAGEYSLKGKVREVKEEFFFAENTFEKISPTHLLYTRLYKFSYNGSIQERELWNNYPTSKKDSLKAPDFIREEYMYTNNVCIINSYTSDSILAFYQEVINWNNKPLQKSMYSGTSDKLMSKITYKYNNRQLETWNAFYSNKNYEKRFDYAIGKKIETYNYKFENLVYKYNVKNQLVELEEYAGQKLIGTTYFSYNKKGDVILEKNIEEETRLIKETSYLYIYDKYNNWTTTVERRFDGNVFLKKRIISYYYKIM